MSHILPAFVKESQHGNEEIEKKLSHLGTLFAMGLIGMPEAARRAKISKTNIMRALRKAGIEPVKFNDRSLAVEETDLERFIADRADYRGIGRPRKVKAAAEQDHPSRI